MLLGDKDTAVIWRGPLKISAIRQFISDIEWGDLDYLVVDSPPGTGDEPLTVAQTISDAEALIVTTPQEVSLADVRKSINFCRQVDMKILGVVENMSGFVCPHCGEKVSIFGSGGATRMASQMEVPLLGQIPLDALMVEMGDKGSLDSLIAQSELEINKAYGRIVNRIDGGS
jgi:Mrp family chromosome partitioning ATPase